MWDDVAERICSEECLAKANDTTQRRTSVVGQVCGLVAGLAIVLSCILGVMLHNSEPYVISVERGQKANITLPDGTNVALNS
ncbi:MAG: hypothetical protein IKJ02_02535, partial [Tidjanibacter sp.]|nr:hypothetical protein [Tidjanibacter sp.]